MTEFTPMAQRSRELERCVRHHPGGCLMHRTPPELHCHTSTGGRKGEIKDGSQLPGISNWLDDIFRKNRNRMQTIIPEILL